MAYKIKATGRWAAQGTMDRFWSKVQMTDGCWLWTAYTRDGYGQFRVDGRLVSAHRFAYEMLIGPIPDGMLLDHVKERGCLHRHCVNPDHLEPVTNRVNTLRGSSPWAARAAQTHCVYGHEFTAENTHTTGRGTRRCRKCMARHNRDRRNRRRAEGKVPT